MINNEVVVFKNLSQYPNIIHFQTTRLGGVSIEEYSSFNFSYDSGDNLESVLRNRIILADKLRVPLDNFVFTHQSHGSNIKAIEATDKGKGVYYDKGDSIMNTDALITNIPNIMLCIKTADCIPILCYDQNKKAIAAIHAGWKGTSEMITPKTIKLMNDLYGSYPEDIIVGIGVGADICCYEVGYEVYEKIIDTININQKKYNIFEEVNNNKIKINLKLINKLQLESVGILSDNIETYENCSICENDIFFSKRASKDKYGLSLSGIYIK